MIQIPQSRFKTDEYNVVIGNISWDLSKPLTEAYYVISIDPERIIHFNDEIRQELNNLYLIPPTRSCVINLWSDHNDPKDFVFTAPQDWKFGLNYWQILSGLDAFLTQGRQKYGDRFTHNRFIKGIYFNETKYSQYGPYLELDYWDS